MKPEAEPEEAEMEVLKLKLKSRIRRRYDFEYRIIFTGSDATGLSFHPHLVQVAATVLEVADAAVGVQLVQQVQVNVRNKDHLRIGRRLRTPSVRRKSEIAGREDSGARILNVHVVHLGQVAHTACDHHETFVLDGAGMGADLHARIGILRIREERHEENLHPLGGHNA